MHRWYVHAVVHPCSTPSLCTLLITDCRPPLSLAPSEATHLCLSVSLSLCSSLCLSVPLCSFLLLYVFTPVLVNACNVSRSHAWPAGSFGRVYKGELCERTSLRHVSPSLSRLSSLSLLSFSLSLSLAWHSTHTCWHACCHQGDVRPSSQHLRVRKRSPSAERVLTHKHCASVWELQRPARLLPHYGVCCRSYMDYSVVLHLTHSPLLSSTAHHSNYCSLHYLFLFLSTYIPKHVYTYACPHIDTCRRPSCTCAVVIAAAVARHLQLGVADCTWDAVLAS